MLNLEQEKENQALRAALVAVCNAATRGHCTGDVSLEFLLHVPAEAVKCYSELRGRLRKLEDDAVRVVAAAERKIDSFRVRINELDAELHRTNAVLDTATKIIKKLTISDRLLTEDEQNYAKSLVSE